MSLFAALTKKWIYSVKIPGAGRLVYREGNREYTFPVFEEEGGLVLVTAPSSQRIHYFFNWYRHPREFPAADRGRILSRVVQFLRAGGAEVRLLHRDVTAGGDFEFHPELFEHRARASELLAAAGFTWFGDYSSIDPVHEEFGLEISGIQNDRQVRPILAVLQRGFPHWHHIHVCRHDGGREPGWRVSICLFPPQACSPGAYDED